jgi:hypothetical protein
MRKRGQPRRHHHRPRHRRTSPQPSRTGADAIFVGWHDNSTNEDGFEVNVTFDGQSSSNTPKVGANPTALTWTDVLGWIELLFPRPRPQLPSLALE